MVIPKRGQEGTGSHALRARLQRLGVGGVGDDPADEVLAFLPEKRVRVRVGPEVAGVRRRRLAWSRSLVAPVDLAGSGPVEDVGLQDPLAFAQSGAEPGLSGTGRHFLDRREVQFDGRHYRACSFTSAPAGSPVRPITSKVFIARPWSGSGAVIWCPAEGMTPEGREA